ncbi:MAG: hypothetical protein ACREON_10465 [Gemmatimonadaceae bacterium]
MTTFPVGTSVSMLPVVPVLAALLASCGAPAARGGEPSPPPPAAQPAEPAAASVERAEFVLRQGDSALVTERFTRTADSVSGELGGSGGPRVTYRAAVARDETIPAITLRLFAPGDTAAGARPTQSVAGTMQGDSAVIRVTEADSVRTVRHQVPAGTVFSLNASTVLLEQMVRRARMAGGDTARVSILPLNRGGQVVTAVVHFVRPDSAHLSVGGAEVHLRVDDRGRILGGRVPAQGLVIERK